MDTNRTMTGKTTMGTKGISSIRYMTVTAMLSAVAFILMFLDFSVPFMPPFIKMDLSELPALIGSFAMGPLCGVLICLIKNVLHLFITTTGGVGELSNFLLGAAFVLPAGLTTLCLRIWCFRLIRRFFRPWRTYCSVWSALICRLQS